MTTLHRLRPSPDDYNIIKHRAYFADPVIDSLRKQKYPHDGDVPLEVWKEHKRQKWEISELRTKALGNPFRPGLVLPPVLFIEPVFAPTNGRPLPSFALNGGSFKLRIERAIVPFEAESQYWHMWLAKVVLPDGRQDCGDVVIKVFQQSLMESPLRDMFTPSATQLACSEDWVYSHLSQIQGVYVPYCFGLYKIKLAYGESIYILLLEWIDAPYTPENMDDESHETVALEPLSPTWLEKKEDNKQLILSTMRSIRALNLECGVFLHDNGEQDHHLILRELGRPPQIVIINFSQCMAEIEESGREEHHYDDAASLISHIIHGRYLEEMGLDKWARENGIPLPQRFT